MSGRIVYPLRLQNKISRMNSNILRIEETISKTKPTLQLLLASSPALSGKAWENCIAFVRENHLLMTQLLSLWCYEEKRANDRYKNATAKLPQVIELNEDDMLDAINKYNEWIDEEYEYEYPSYSCIHYWERQKSNLERKIWAIVQHSQVNGHTL